MRRNPAPLKLFLGVILAALAAAPSCDRVAQAEKAGAGPGAERSSAGAPAAEVSGKPALLDGRAIARIPQSNRVTIAARDLPLADLLRSLSQQAGWTVERSGSGISQEVKASLSLQSVPFLEALGELCSQRRWSLEEVRTMDEGRILKVEIDDPEMPIRAFQAQGPLMITWHGLCTTVDHDLHDPARSTKIIRYRLGYSSDPRACLDVGDGTRAVREIPVTFIVDGKEITLHSDHRPNVFESGVPAWEFKPERLAGKRLDLRVTLPFCAPTETASVELPFEDGAQAVARSVQATLSRIRKEEANARDPRDPFRSVKVDEWSAEVLLIHTAAASGKLPLERLLLRAVDAEASLAVGASVRGRIETAEGLSSPLLGFRYRVTARTPRGTLRPRKVALQIRAGYEPMEAAFEISNLPLGR